MEFLCIEMTEAEMPAFSLCGLHLVSIGLQEKIAILPKKKKHPIIHVLCVQLNLLA